MSGTIVNLVNHSKWGWMLEWGHETFYDGSRALRTWNRPQAAIDWLKDNHPELTLVIPDGTVPIGGT